MIKIMIVKQALKEKRGRNGGLFYFNAYLENSVIDISRIGKEIIIMKLTSIIFMLYKNFSILSSVFLKCVCGDNDLQLPCNYNERGVGLGLKFIILFYFYNMKLA